MMKGALIEKKRGYQDSRKEENFSVSPATFPPCAWVTEHFEDSGHVALISRSSLFDSFIECYGWRRPLSSFTPMLTSSIGVGLQGRNKLWHEWR
jgi:hypothetical protein